MSELEQALEHCADADWLTTHSPLTSPYFIGNFVRDGRNADALGGRGHVLQRALRDAAALLRDDQQRLLRLSFSSASPMPTPTASPANWVGRGAAYYRHRTAAIQALAQQLHQTIVPPLHLEQPRFARMVGREDVLTACLAALRQKQTIAITGGSGIGKTTLGAALAAQWMVHQRIPLRAFTGSRCGLG
ncbi:MAG: hypothetical protein HC853_16835 [Anaerolineae bacterium]|nr:hypothetical protein [Anaerolineae bacterium]